MLFRSCLPDKKNTPPVSSMTPAVANPRPTATATVIRLPTAHPTLTISPTSVPETTPAQTNDGLSLSLVGETVPDGSIVQPGQSFTKSWTVKNSGSLPWTTDFSFICLIGEIPGGIRKISLPHEVQPGQSLELSVDLTAPSQNGTYTLTYQLQDASGLDVPGAKVWVNISVGQPSSGGAAAGSGVSVRLTGFEVQPTTTTVHFCMSYPDASRNWMITSALAVNLHPDQQSIAALSGGGANGCYDFDFEVNSDVLNQAASLSVSIASIWKEPNDKHARCEAIKPGLINLYPGLDFQCEGLHSEYSHLILPDSLSRETANTLIVDAINNTIYGPWVLNIR